MRTFVTDSEQRMGYEWMGWSSDVSSPSSPCSNSDSCSFWISAIENISRMLKINLSALSGEQDAEVDILLVAELPLERNLVVPGNVLDLHT